MSPPLSSTTPVCLGFPGQSVVADPELQLSSHTCSQLSNNSSSFLGINCSPGGRRSDRPGRERNGAKRRGAFSWMSGTERSEIAVSGVKSLAGIGVARLQWKTRTNCPLSPCCVVSALVEVEIKVEGGRGVLSDEQNGGAPRAQRRVQDAHCTSKWPHNGSVLGMATRCSMHHLVRVGPS